ncbi:MAG: hypothetical protein AAF996_09960 [Pseudomonadota bacterium]
MKKWTKKTEKIEVRVPPEVKSKFLETCDQRGKTASSVVRGLIENYVDRFHVASIANPILIVKRMPWWSRLSVLGAITTTLSLGVVVPLQATSQIPWAKKFDQQDRNGNGILEPHELGVRLIVDHGTASSENTRSGQPLSFANFERFTALDQNNDYKITRSEFRAHQIAEETNMFQAFDANSDGSIGFEELNFPEQQVAQYRLRMLMGFSQLNNGVGQRHRLRWRDHLCFEPWFASDHTAIWDMAPVFDEMDQNDDCRLTLREFASY